jgi:hypothetical protein
LMHRIERPLVESNHQVQGVIAEYYSISIGLVRVLIGGHVFSPQRFIDRSGKEF